MLSIFRHSEVFLIFYLLLGKIFDVALMIFHRSNYSRVSLHVFLMVLETLVVSHLILMQFIEKYLSFSLFSFLLIQSGKSKSLIFLLLHIFEFSPCVMLVLKHPRIIALPLLVSDRLISLLILEILLVRLHLQVIHILLHHHHIIRSVLLLLHICD